MKFWTLITTALIMSFFMSGCTQTESVLVTTNEVGDLITKISDQDSYVVTIENTDPQANENVVQTWTEDGFHYSVWEQENIPQGIASRRHNYVMMKWNEEQKTVVMARMTNSLGQIEMIDRNSKAGAPSNQAIFNILLTPGITEDKEGLHLEEGYHLEKEGEDTIVLKSDDKNGLKAAIQLKDGKITKIESTYEGNTKTATVSVPDTASEAYKKKVEEILNTERLEANDPLNGPLSNAIEN